MTKADGLPPHNFHFNHPAHTEIYTLSLHDALPIYTQSKAVQTVCPRSPQSELDAPRLAFQFFLLASDQDRKSTRLNSSHRTISYAVFCLKKKRCGLYFSWY